MGKPQYQKPSDVGMKGWCVKVFKKFIIPKNNSKWVFYCGSITFPVDNTNFPSP
jgi:hypothetical protein